MIQEFKFYLAAGLGLKKGPAWSQDLNLIKYIMEYKYYYKFKAFSIYWV